VRFSIELPDSVAKAVDVEGLRGRARAKGIADFACEVGHGRGTRRFIWHLHCSREVTELLVSELDQVSGTAATLDVRDSCARVAVVVRGELDRPLRPGEFHHRIVNTVSPQRTGAPTVHDAGLIHHRPGSGRPDE
jgi:hypothetical protein